MTAAAEVPIVSPRRTKSVLSMVESVTFSGAIADAGIGRDGMAS
jgi:hypothetical protein